MTKDRTHLRFVFDGPSQGEIAETWYTEAPDRSSRREKQYRHRPVRSQKNTHVYAHQKCDPPLLAQLTSGAEQSLLHVPVQGQNGAPGQHLHGEVWWLAAVRDRVNDLRGEEREPEEAADIARADCLLRRNRLDRGCAPRGEIVKPPRARATALSRTRSTFGARVRSASITSRKLTAPLISPCPLPREAHQPKS